jgi:hypothetical protein
MDGRTRMEKHAAKHGPCSTCSKGLFVPDYCKQGYCAESNSVV